MTTQTAARIYKVGEDGELTMDTLPETAFVKTYSNNAQVTDSAPSMAAYMTGVKMNNEVISMTPETSAFDVLTGKDYLNGTDSTCPASGNGKAVPTLLEIAKAAGMGTGAVTTTRVTHATPATTYSHVCHRDGENTIAAQGTPGNALYNAALTDGLDVLLAQENLALAEGRFRRLKGVVSGPFRGHSGGAQLRTVLNNLGERGLTRVLVEGGASLATSLLDDRFNFKRIAGHHYFTKCSPGCTLPHPEHHRFSIDISQCFSGQTGRSNPRRDYYNCFAHKK